LAAISRILDDLERLNRGF